MNFDYMNLLNKKSRSRFGYGYAQPGLTFARFTNGAVAIFFMILSLPVVVLVSIVVRILIGSPVFYSGTRYGQGKKSFTMYKFRTLPRKFQDKNLAQLVSHKHGRLPMISKVLRETRIDEIPQLLNILKGDMEFMGPRPVRPEVYNTYCRKINGYDQRFLVKPGLIGYAQLLTPHSSPKRLRSHIDNRAIHNQRQFFFNSYIVLLTIFVVIKRTVIMLYKIVIKNFIKIKLIKQYNEKRGLDRIRLKNSLFCLYQNKNNSLSHSYYSDLYKEDSIAQGNVYDINEEFLRVDTNALFNNNNEIIFTLCIKGKDRLKRPLSKTAWCKGTVYKRYQGVGNHKYTYIIEYQPITELNMYMIDQYFLSKSLIKHVF